MAPPKIQLPADVVLEDGYVVVASVSGGKDSTALILALREAEIPARYVFADTGWEAPETYQYLDDLRRILEITIDVVGHPGGMLQRIKEKNDFPGKLKRWCTQDLKITPLRVYHDAIEATGCDTINAVGVRAEESVSRSKMEEWQDDPKWGGFMWRPLISWKVADVIEIHKRHGVPMNPLYHAGFSRVGCYPCIFAQKDEIRLIADRSPKRIDLIRAMEEDQQARYAARCEAKGTVAKPHGKRYFSERGPKGLDAGIDAVVAWSSTDRGG